MSHDFFDTSALVKHYHTELGSPEVDQILGESGSRSSIARLTLTEVLSVFAKKVRMGAIADPDYDRLRLRFYADVRNRTLIPVRILTAHFESAGSLIGKFGKTRQLPTLDALQLAVALRVHQATPLDHFVSADQRLCDIAILEALAVINPELP
jgi:predicted nucleic acid-binding protein